MPRPARAPHPCPLPARGERVPVRAGEGRPASAIATPARGRRSGRRRPRRRRDRRTRLSSMPSPARTSAGTDACVMIAGCSIRLSTPPRLSAQRERSGSARGSRRARRAPPLTHDGDHAAEAVHLPLRQRVLRMARQAGIDARVSIVGWRLEPLRRSPARSRSARCMRSGSVFRPRSARKLSNGPCTPPTAFCRKPSFSASSALSPTTTMPPTMSEWPFRYLVAECITMSKPSSSGRCRNGVANVLSATARMPRLARDRGDRREVDQLEQRVGRRFDPDHPRVGPDRGLELRALAQVDEGELEPGRAPAHALEQPVRAAVEVVAARRRGCRCRAARAPSRSRPGPRRTRSRGVPPSSSATQRSNAKRVGLWVREYSKPLCTPGLDCA